MDNPHLAALAAEARAVYMTERNNWHRTREGRVTCYGAEPITAYDGGETATGRRLTAVWPRLVNFALKHGIDLRVYIREQFQVRSARPPEPNELLSERTVQAHKAASQSVRGPEELARIFAFQRERLLAEFDKMWICKVRHGWTDQQVHRAALTSGALQLSALFRYCVAVKYGYQDLAEEFFDRALMQYMGRQKEYDLVWGSDWLPPALSEAARVMLNQSRSSSGVAAPDPVPGARAQGSAAPAPAVPAAHAAEPGLRRIRPME